MKKKKIGAVLLLALTIYNTAAPSCAAIKSSDTVDAAEISDATVPEACLASVSDDICFVSAVSNNTGTVCQNDEEAVDALSDSVQVSSRLWELLFGKKDDGGAPEVLCPGGGVFGVKIKSENLTVTKSRGIPALKSGDTIISINGQRVHTVADITKILKNCGGESVTIRALHAGEEIGLEVRPSLIDGEYKLGLTLRDGAAGIGTVTFIDPQTGMFGGLGHGICDAENGEVVDMESGEICEAVLGGIHKGESGKPGELCGILTDTNLGELTINSDCGVFGYVDTSKITLSDPLPIGNKSDITEGDATIISTLKNGKTTEYKIRIHDIDRSSSGSKSFKITVTDPTLIAVTGGIVKGMSGSPIIQNGKLVGAVTHVLINDPTTGYGIFIENMLNAAQMPMAKAA